MESLASLLRAYQLYAHNAHNLCKGSLFFADHEFLGELYSQAEGHYDSVVERAIGLGQPIDLIKVQMDAVVTIKDKPQQVNENKVYFQTLLDMCGGVYSAIDALCKSPGLSEGTKNLLQGIADQHEMIKYKLKQRIR